MVRPAILLALVLTLAPACGHKGPPLPPRRRTPPTLSDFRLAQRGAALEISCTAPTASVEGVPFDRVDIELFWGEGWVDVEKKGQQRTLRAEPGARVVDTVPLPPPGTLVRAAARAVAGRDKGQRSLILALETHEPLSPPDDLNARLRARGVTLSWRGARPEELPPPDLGPVGGSRRPFARGPSSAPKAAPREGDDSPTPDAASEGTRERRGEARGEGGGQAAGFTPSDEPAPDEAIGDAVRADEDTTEGDATIPAPPLPRSHGFRVYRRLPPGAYRAPLNPEPQERRLFTDTDAPLGANVCYVVRAVGSVEPLIESAPSNEVCLDVRDIAPPSPPSGLAVVPRDEGLEVVWSPSSDSDLGGYRIYRASGAGEPERVGEVPAGTTTWLDTAPQPGVLHRYTVTAFDQAGNESPPSGAAQGRGP
ncbi:MAG: fibronectin type III domain-containing protein [Acidobacteria bacterium]|nr:fibronectin type III domain-containing protein [Acidobacteriota bacterium]